MFSLLTLGAIICLTCLVGIAFCWKQEHKEIPVVLAKTIIGSFSGFFFIALALVVAAVFNISPMFAQEGVDTATKLPPEAYGLGFLGAGLSVGLACVGTGIATGMAASAAIGAVSENPKMLGPSLLFVGLSEGIAIYGLIIAIMILGPLG